MNKLFIRIGIFSAIVILVACGGDSSPGYEYMPNMYRSPSIETYGEHNIDGYNGVPVEGTIAQGKLSKFNYNSSDEDFRLAGGYKLDSGAILINYKGDSVSNDGTIINIKKEKDLVTLGSDTTVLGTSFFPSSFIKDSINLKKGGEIYGMMCAHCHGPTGGGDGKIALATFANNPYDVMPAFNDSEKKRPRNNLPMTDFTEGHIFHTITYGYGKMGPHASQISEKERWKIVYYIKEKLQK